MLLALYYSGLEIVRHLKHLGILSCFSYSTSSEFVIEVITLIFRDRLTITSKTLKWY